MSQGTLYVYPESGRSYFLIDLVKYFKLDIEIVDAKNTKNAKFERDFPLKKFPAFSGPKGFKLTETVAIINYLLSLVSKTTLLGKNAQDYSSILRWLSITNNDIVLNLVNAILPIVGVIPYNKKTVDIALSNIKQIAAILESRLSQYTYLVGERLSVADLFSVTILSWGLKTVLAQPFLKEYPAINRWFKTVTSGAFFAGRFKGFEIPAQPLEFVPSKKEKKPQAPKAEKKAEKKAEPKDEDEPIEEKKEKHLLEVLGKSKMPIDEWKRVYSNEDTRPKALPWFWEHYDPSEWSLYRVDFKYNDELTLTFMSNNLVGGFFNRLIASTKYLFGCMVVYGENNNNGITGAFLVRGQDFVPAFRVAPDWESYEFKKLDATSEEDKAFINNMWAWDEPVIVNGEKREIADGKVFK